MWCRFSGQQVSLEVRLPCKLSQAEIVSTSCLLAQLFLPCSAGGDVSGDVFPISGTLQFLTGVSQQTLTLSILADDIPEETEV